MTMALNNRRKTTLSDKLRLKPAVVTHKLSNYRYHPRFSRKHFIIYNTKLYIPTY